MDRAQKAVQLYTDRSQILIIFGSSYGSDDFLRVSESRVNRKYRVVVSTGIIRLLKAASRRIKVQYQSLVLRTVVLKAQ